MRQSKEVRGIVADGFMHMKPAKITVRIIKDSAGASMAVWDEVTGIEYIVDLDELKDMIKVVEK